MGQFEADFYNINGFQIESKKRREHLSEDDVQSNKALIESLKKSLENSKNNESNNDEYETDDNGIDSPNMDKNEKPKRGQNTVINSSSSSSMNELLLESTNGANQEVDDEDEDDGTLAALDKQTHLLQIKRRKSLPPPNNTTITWVEYINAPKGSPPTLARPLKSKESSRTFKATLAMSKEFPLSIESLLNVLEVVAPFKHFNKLRQFIQMNLPPGFPVKIGMLKLIYYFKNID